MGIEAYRETQKHVESPRATEYRRLGELNALLITADLTKTDAVQWAQAVWQNQQFWSRLRVSLVSASTSLPQDLRVQFIVLAEWVEKESVRAAAGEGGLEHLIAINQQIMEGLRPYTGALENDALRAAAE